MSGGIAALVATGAQDVHIVGDPQISFFRSNYKRHTNFSQVRHRQVVQGNPSANGMSTVRFERKGDMLSYTYLTAKDGAANETNVAQYIDHVELYIGGQRVDNQDSVYSNTIWPQVEASTTNKAEQSATAQSHYPLHFFFCDNWAQALPLVALQYHDVEIRIYWSSTDPSSKIIECWSNFIYLDDAERGWFSSNPINMLVKQVQENTGSGEKTQEFSYNHPVAYIATQTGNPTNGTAASLPLTFKINGTDFGDAMEITPHYNEVPHFHHCVKSATNPPCFLMPFALNLGDLKQPSGSLNFSRLDNARLLIDATSDREFNAAKFYAVNYNVLRIENGLGGMLYSN